jgi:hypothetical protein
MRRKVRSVKTAPQSIAVCYQWRWNSYFFLDVLSSTIGSFSPSWLQEFLRPWKTTFLITLLEGLNRGFHSDLATMQHRRSQLFVPSLPLSVLKPMLETAETRPLKALKE